MGGTARSSRNAGDFVRHFLPIIMNIPQLLFCDPFRALIIRADRTWHLSVKEVHPLVLKFYREGSAEYCINGSKITLRKGEMLFVNQGCRVRAVPHPTELPVEYVLRFSIRNNADRQEISYPELPLFRRIHPPDFYHSMTLFHECIHYANQNNGPVCRKIAQGLLNQILFEMLLEEQGIVPTPDPRIERVRLYMEENPRDRSTIQKLAGIGALSPRYFAALFKKQFGMMPKTYQLRLRCRYAQHLLEETDMSVKQVAYHLDYADPHAFSKQFKKVIGFAPSVLLQQKTGTATTTVA